MDLRAAAGVGADLDRVVLGPVGGEQFGEAFGGPAIFRRGVRERFFGTFVLLEREEADDFPDGVAHHRREATLVLGDVDGVVFVALHRHRHDFAGDLQLLPFVEQACIDRADRQAKPVGHVVERIGLGRLGHRLNEPLVRVGQIAKQDAFGTLQPVLFDVLDEAHAELVHVSRDRFRPQHVAPDPAMMLGEDFVGRVEQVGSRLRVLDLVELGHALFVLHAVGFHGRERAALQRVGLPVEDGPRIFERRLDQGEHVERVGRVILVENVDGLDDVERECLIEGEIRLEVFMDARPFSVELDDAGVPQ